MKRDFWKTIARAAIDYGFYNQDRLHKISLESIVASGRGFQIFQFEGVWGDTPLVDLAALCALVSNSQPKTLFEFGTFTGNATLHMLRNADRDAHIHTLDLPPRTRESIGELSWEKSIQDELIGSRFRNVSERERITQWLADTREFDTSALKQSIDFIWVDACHEYEFVKNDTQKSLEMIKSGGLIAWHDHSVACPGVVAYLDELSKDYVINKIVGTQVAFSKIDRRV